VHGNTGIPQNPDFMSQDCLSTTNHCLCDVRAESGVKQ
jgi:hypothetical protein